MAPKSYIGIDISQNINTTGDIIITGTGNSNFGGTGFAGVTVEAGVTVSSHGTVYFQNCMGELLEVIITASICREP